MGNRRKILIIDDQEDIACALALGLQRNGMDADAYTDPVKAAEDFKPDIYDLVLLDVRMPRMNGFEVYRELRKVDEEVKICFLTAFALYENEFKKMFPEVHVHKFLTKPITIAALVKEINEILALKQETYA